MIVECCYASALLTPCMCTTTDGSSCDHGMAYVLYTESIKYQPSSTHFLARQCASWKYYNNKSCPCGHPVQYMGFNTDPRQAFSPHSYVKTILELYVIQWFSLYVFYHTWILYLPHYDLFHHWLVWFTTQHFDMFHHTSNKDKSNFCMVLSVWLCF